MARLVFLKWTVCPDASSASRGYSNTDTIGSIRSLGPDSLLPGRGESPADAPTTSPKSGGKTAGAASSRASSGEIPATPADIIGDADALPPEHMLTDFPKDPKDSRCVECMRSKAQNSPHRRQKGKEPIPPGEEIDAASFGDLMTADHCDRG